MLEALYRQSSMKSLWRLADWAYTDATPLWLRNGMGVASEYILSANGVRQGCGLGALLFALSMKEIYDRVQANSPSVRVVAIMDDLFLLGKPEDCVKAYTFFTELCERNGSLSVNHEGGKFMCFSSIDQVIRYIHL